MKWVISLFLGLVLFSGCSSKPNDLTFSLYQPTEAFKVKSVSIEKVYIKSVIDLRSNTRAIGTFEDDGDVYLVETKTNLGTWFYDAIERGLVQKGYKIIPRWEKEAMYLKVSILKIGADYNERVVNGDNMIGRLQLRVKYKKRNIEQIDDIYVSQGGYFSSLPDKEEYEEFIQKMLNKGVDKIIQKTLVY